MYGKLIRNDIRRSKLISSTIAAFILLAAMLTALAASLVVNLLGAIDNMLEQAKTPDFMQMHSGEIDFGRLDDFASRREDVAAFQVLDFLNIEGSDMVIGGESLAASVQDNGLAVQSEAFDFLLDTEGQIIRPSRGEVYVPLYYMKEGAAQLGDEMTVHGKPFQVAGFLRDSQMNSAIVSSKRFLVNEGDFEELRPYGKREYLIEFSLVEGADLAAFETAYLDAGLENEGPPPITAPLFRVANGMTDGIMIAVLVLVSLLVVVVTFLCIRFTLLAKVEEDYREIGVLKAVGMRVSQVKKLYMAKYGLLAGIGCLLGFLLSLLFQGFLMENIRLYMGESGRESLGILAGIVGACLIFGVVLLYVNGVLGRFRKISPAQAIRFGAPAEKAKGKGRFRLRNSRLLSTNAFLGTKDVLARKGLYATMFLVLVISAFIMIVPRNIYSTISSRNFMTYMGIGQCDMRIDLQQVEQIAEKTKDIDETLALDESVAKHTILTSYMFDMVTKDGIQRLKVELGDHAAFPIAYAQGRAPETAQELALSSLNADDLELALGDGVMLVVDGAERPFTVCGIYSDITNGGKTAKAAFQTGQKDILWSIIPVALKNPSQIDDMIGEYRDRFPYGKVSKIDDYIDQTFGNTVEGIHTASQVSLAATILLTVLITLLFMKMLVAKDRYSIAVLKSLGFSSKDVRRQYMVRSALVFILGVGIGTLLANTLGEGVGAAMISSFGASTFRFEVDPWFAYLLAPGLIALCVWIATLLGIKEINTLKISDWIKE